MCPVQPTCLGFLPMADTPVQVVVNHTDDGVVTLTLNYAERRNTMSADMTAAWQQAIVDIAGDPTVRAVMVIGAGSAFCAGGDLSWIGGDPHATVTQLRAKMLPFYRAWLSIRNLEVPTLAAINGPAVGAGAAIALACDVRVASPSARFSVPFVHLGLHPGMATTHLLREVAGVAVARDLLLTGRTVNAPEMLRMGIVTDVLDGADFAAAAHERAARMAAGAPIAARLTKLALAREMSGSLADAIAWEGMAQPITMATEDVHLGLAAARERRTPEFRGE